MKTFAFTAIAIWTIAACQPVKKEAAVPEKITTAFKTIHPNATDIRWIQEPSIFEAKFRDGEMQGAISFNDQAEVVETEEVIREEQLPNHAGILDYIKSNYNGETIQRSEKIIKRDGIVMYELQITGKELIFDAEGNFSEEEPD